MAYPVTCSCNVCPKCRHRERCRQKRLEKSPSIKTFRYGKGILKLDETFPAKDSSPKNIYFGPSFPGSTLDPNRMFILRDAKEF